MQLFHSRGLRPTDWPLGGHTAQVCLTPLGGIATPATSDGNCGDDVLFCTIGFTWFPPEAAVIHIQDKGILQTNVRLRRAGHGGRGDHLTLVPAGFRAALTLTLFFLEHQAICPCLALTAGTCISS